MGKTYLVDAFAAEHFENVVKFDLVEDAAVLSSFSQARSAEDLYLRISLAARVPLVPGESVVFIDEVQKAPEIITFVKYLVQNTGLRYILSGSLLGIEVKSGSDYMTHAALDNARAVRGYHIDEAIVLAETNVKVRDGIAYLPIYSACLMVP